MTIYDQIALVGIGISAILTGICIIALSRLIRRTLARIDDLELKWANGQMRKLMEAAPMTDEQREKP